MSMHRGASFAVGTKVEHVQHIEGVKFYYYPPPKSRGQGAKETVNLPSVTTGSI